MNSECRIQNAELRIAVVGTLLLALSSAGLIGAEAAPIKVDDAAHKLSFPGKAAKQRVYEQLKGAVEYLLCMPGGKEYESLFVCPVDPSALHDALVKLGIRPGKPACEEGNKYLLPQGGRARIFVEWNDGKENRRERAESFVLDQVLKKNMPEVDWVFTGSCIAKDPETGKDVLQAALVKNLVSLHHQDKTVLLQNPLKEAADSSRYSVNAQLLPKEGTPVTIVIEPAPAAKKRDLPEGWRHVHLQIGGAVQGVGFREFTLRNARQMGLQGWVRNMPNGTVELEAEGPDAAMKDFEEKLQKGPRSAKVEKVEALPGASAEDLGEFEIRETPVK